MLYDILALAGGLALLMAAAAALVHGAASAALRLGLSPLVVGLTVVAFGTSAPELVVTVQAALAGAGGIAVGNVVGSNIANVGLILGFAVLVRPIATDPSILRRDLPVLLGITAAVIALLLDGRLGVGEGLVLVAALAAYLGWSVRQGRREAVSPDLPVVAPGPVWRDALLVAGGLGGLALGADVFVGGAVALARDAGVSNAVIGLTVVAVGTSLPELATSVVAAARGEGAMAVGNVVGSNVFNLLGILGVGAIVGPLVAPGLEPVDLAVMAAFAVVLLPMMWTGRRLVRPEAAVLLAGYTAYLSYLVVQHG
ncbi:calcium/sodium antiporter [Rubrivirga sp. IMCC45206]|uniref:calcium/sodium antiporter n=1 Tax=Rubrivirga sp. IMCC45206 TaxID=3391614 RepID=UPI00398FD694